MATHLDIGPRAELMRAIRGRGVSATARDAGVSRATVHRYVTGEHNITVGNFLTLAHALGFEVRLRRRAGKSSA